MGNIGPLQLVIILFVVLLLFGSKKLPGLARSLGQSLNEFKRGKDEIAKEIADTAKDSESSDPEIAEAQTPPKVEAPADKQEAKI